MMNTSSDMSFSSQQARSTYLKIRTSVRLNVTDFMKALVDIPSAFVPSVFHNKWTKENKNRPSDVLKAQLDPRTMTWKDMYVVGAQENDLPPEMQDPKNKPKIRPIPSVNSCEISLESAQGIPQPKDSEEFHRDMIMKRAVRVGIFNSATKDYIANAVQVQADLQKNTEDKWVFPKTDISLNPLIFRNTASSQLDMEKTKFIFEFVIYYKKGAKETELCCGWAEQECSAVINRSATTTKLEVHGGSPTTLIMIQKDDVHTKRTGLQGLIKAFSSKITS